MPIDSNAPRFVLAAVQRLYAELPDLIGDDWPSVQPQVDAHIATLQAQPDAYLASTQLFGLLARHYGFTNEELDFIINDDIKYRMGDDLGGDEGEA